MSTFATNNPFRDPVGQKQQEGDHLKPPEDDQVGSQSPDPPATPTRGSRESSPSRSEYAASIPELGTSSAKALDFFHSNSHHNIRIHDNTGRCIYYAENSTFTPNKPDVILFKGDDKQGFPISGVARWSSMRSKNVEIGLGDPGSKNTHASSIPWERMESTSFLKQNEHKWSMPNDPQRRVYVWKRTSHVGVEDEHNSLSTMNFKLLDGETNEVLATFASNRFKSWKKLGKLTLRKDLGKEWELMVLLGCLALVEKSRRRARTRRSGHGTS